MDLAGAFAYLDDHVNLETDASARAAAKRLDRVGRLVELMAIALQCSLLLRHGDPRVAEVFCMSRLGDSGHQFGTLRPNPALAGIVERHRPAMTV